MADRQTDVIVVGGGIAGLVAATALAREGFGCIVIESEPILGGRARSWEDPKTGDPIHIGPHIFLTHYPNFLAFQDMVGARGTIRWQEGRFLTMVDGRTPVEIKHSELPPPYHFAPSLLEDPQLNLGDLASNWPMVQLALEISEDEVQALDSMNGLGFLRTMGVSEAFIERFWTFVCFTILNIPVEHASAGAMMRFYRRLIANADLQFGFPDGGLGDTFVPQSIDYLDRRGSEVWTERSVVEFTGTADRVTGVVLGDGTTIAADHVISSVPPMALRRLSRREWIDRHQTFADLVRYRPVPYKCVYLWFDRKLTDRQFWARYWDANDLNSDFYDYSNIISGWEDRPSFIQSNIIWCHRVEGWTDEEIVAATVDELCEFVPEARDATLEHWVVNHVPLVICAPYPGIDRIRPDVATPISGLTLAGDWIQTGFPSTMESAATSGWMAAEDVLHQHGIERRLRRARADLDGIGPLFRKLAPLLPNRRRPRWIDDHSLPREGR
jgi:15-cis-phytoene desaturase